MSVFAYMQIALSIAFVSVGQVLFKYVSILINFGNPLLGFRVIFFATLAFVVSGCGSLIWIYLLRNIELSKAYPFMALTFAVVPLLGVIFYAEQLSAPYFFGVAFIFFGIVVIARYAS